MERQIQMLREEVDTPNQLVKLKALVGNPEGKDEILEFCLENASDIICDIRNSDRVEKKYRTAQISIATEIYNRRGVEGQLSHAESGLLRVYEKGDLSSSVLSRITPMVRTPNGKVRVV